MPCRLPEGFAAAFRACGLLLVLLAMSAGRGPEAQGDERARTTPSGVGTGSAGSAADQAALEAWTRDLGHLRYSVRESAERRLLEAGPRAVPVVGAAARSGQLEVVVRCLRILAAWAEDEREEYARPARAQLVELSRRPVNVAGQRAASILVTLAARDEEQARAMMLRLGAVYGSGSNFNNGRTLETHLVLARNWRGGVEGLKWLERIPSVDYVSFRTQPLTDDAIPYLAALKHLQKLELYGTKLTPEGLQKLRDALPSTEIDFRRGGMLGISTLQTGGPPCVITNVREGSGADKAGLLANDVILRADGHQIGDFSALTAVISLKAPGETMNLEIDRGGRQISLTVTLGEWEWEPLP